MGTELRDLQLRVVSGGASQEPPPSAEDFEAARAGLQWPLLPQAVRDFPEVQAVLAEAAGAIRHIAAATAEFDASGRSEWAETDDYGGVEFDGVGRAAAETVYMDLRSPVGGAAAQSPGPLARPLSPSRGRLLVAPLLPLRAWPSTPPRRLQGHRGGFPITCRPCLVESAAAIGRPAQRSEFRPPLQDQEPRAAAAAAAAAWP